MKRILIVITSLKTGGAEKLVTDMAPILKNNNFQVEILVLDPTETHFSKLLKELGIKVMRSSMFSIYNPLYILKVSSLIKKYDLLHVHLFPALYWVGFAKFFFDTTIKLVYTEHSTSNRRRKKAFWRLLDNWVYKQYDKIVTISDEVDKLLKKHLNLPKYRYIRINNGINLQEIQKAVPTNESFFSVEGRNQKLILQVSSFRWQKDQKTLIRALQELPINVKLLLAGDGPLKEECENYAKEMNVFDRIKFLGIRNDIPQLLKAVDIVVLSSNHEGLSLASIEGMASGRPFIASNVPGLKDIVKGAGLLFPRGNEKILAKHISNLLADNEYYQKVAQACIERAKEFDINRMVDKYLSLYTEVVSNKYA